MVEIFHQQWIIQHTIFISG